MENYSDVSLLFIPSCTPQFSPIGCLLFLYILCDFLENMFGFAKHKLKSFIFENNEETI